MIAKRGGESGEWRRERGVRLITSLQANLYFELIFALPTWREGKKGEIQLRRRDWETEFGELTSAGRMLGKWNQTFWKLIKEKAGYKNHFGTSLHHALSKSI